MATRDRTKRGDASAGQGVPRAGRQSSPDTVTRLLHASLVIAFLGAWLSAEWVSLRAWHIAFGYVVAGGLLARLAWSLARAQAPLARWWCTLRGAMRRLHSRDAGSLRAATWSVAGMALVVCGILVLVPGCFVTGWALGRLVEAAAMPVAVHRWMGSALMVVVATHVALIGVLGVLRGRCMACDMLPGGRDRSR